MPGKPWTDEQIALLHQHKDNLDECVIPGKSRQAAKTKALRLGIIDRSGRAERHVWTEEENDVIREYGHLPVYKFSKYLPHLTCNQIKDQRKRIDVKYNKSDWVRKYSFNEEYFQVPNLENCYWAGFIAGDGCISWQGTTVYLSIKLQAPDRCILEQFQKDIKFTGNIAFCKKRKSSHQHAVHLRISGAKKLVEDLENNFNITPRKTYTLKPPNLQGDLALAFIKGLLDSDGQINIYKNNRLRIGWSGTKELLDWVQQQLNIVLNRGFCTKIQQKGDSVCHELIFDNKLGCNIAKILHQIPTPELKRKWDKIEQWTNNKS